MKSIFRFSGVIVLLFAIYSCKEDKPTPPVVTTTAVSEITATTSKSGGTISADGGAAIITCGVCWSKADEPTIEDQKTTDAISAGSFTSNIANLEGGTVYYVRAYATNSAGTGYGTVMSFTTLGLVPTTTNSAVTNITATGATLNGSVNANFLTTEVTFEYGTSTSYGQSITATQSPVTGNTITNVSAAITGLAAGTTYHIRVKAVNSLGTTYSNDLNFTTLGQVPTVTTLAGIGITSNGATLNGTVNANYLSTVVLFEYGTSTTYGQSVIATQSPVTGNAIANVSSVITGLIESTVYHYRVKAVNILGTSNGSDLTFTTSPLSAVTDLDGNIYNVLRIGTQVWMKENLKTTKYNDGTAIPNITVAGTWSALTTGAFSDYNNTPSNSTTYGRLYNWYVVDNNVATKVASNGGKNVCPTGWHVPSDAEWTTLEDYLIANGYNYDGTTTGNKIAKSLASTSGWITSTTTGAVGNTDFPAKRNATGFTALPGGNRYFDGTYGLLENYGLWWSSTEYSSTDALSKLIYNIYVIVGGNSLNKKLGLSVRCLMDN